MIEVHVTTFQRAWTRTFARIDDAMAYFAGQHPRCRYSAEVLRRGVTLAERHA